MGKRGKKRRQAPSTTMLPAHPIYAKPSTGKHGHLRNGRWKVVEAAAKLHEATTSATLPMNKASDTLFIGNLDKNAVSRASLAEHLDRILSLPSSYSSEPHRCVIRAIRMECYPRTGAFKGYALVKFDDEDTAAKGLSLLNGSLLEGKPLKVDFSRNGPMLLGDGDALSHASSASQDASLEADGNEDGDGGQRRSRPKKRVRFEQQDRLCQVQYFESDPQERVNPHARTCSIS